MSPWTSLLITGYAGSVSGRRARSSEDVNFIIVGFSGLLKE
jgi:hypothetical protein